MPKIIGLTVVIALVALGCGKRETDAERRQREANDLCYKAIDCLNAGEPEKRAEAKALLEQAMEIDPFCEKARTALVSMHEANINAAKRQIGLFVPLLTMYRMDIGNYPTTAQGLEALRLAPADLPKSAKWGGPYLDSKVPLDPWGNPYQYACPGTHSGRLGGPTVNEYSFDVWSSGPQDGTEGEIGNW
jgi:general secretion pathway protein G